MSQLALQGDGQSRDRRSESPSVATSHLCSSPTQAQQTQHQIQDSPTIGRAAVSFLDISDDNDSVTTILTPPPPPLTITITGAK
ncbi:hypothetical protein PFICI_01264 [Pestalotiopsis fici W106-1]|uniref:Uncharacterized protein n=1 Tax=Pestalotiopsis fici (strain W106-1 / CGMCC3.15140) TaxID=1229662 RepID=W3XQA2_PESFW|nr:uncharacterized protein PFICI_01264 [Pestalotiopsis fici W106-1]ETS87436.1 hypothetical protein PFICI_01264 [Pestalotiopsis fici W106-1]